MHVYISVLLLRAICLSRKALAPGTGVGRHHHCAHSQLVDGPGKMCAFPVFFFFFIKRILRWDKSLITTSPCLRSTRFWQVDMICLSQCRWPAVSEITSQDHSPTWHPAAPGLAAAAWRGISSPCPPHVVLRMGKLMFRFHARLLPKIIQKLLLQ